ncbi:LptA/OstA family protein [Cognatishimia activa]|uniref:LptA/OstA family protein n=1 Tax=Cognatishimia activa TaxID=1715691 RepID=UPI00222EBEA2|nr:LptA/OstA family protein [Cognatishimia activa]UZD90650.1 LPS export ABC transporter periplasmic protein LptC [Cognatishimia activa]
MYRLLAVCLALALTSAAYAQEFKVDFGISSNDPNAPIEVQADSLSVDQETGNAKFQGDVVITQGDMRFEAPLVEVTYNEAQDGISKLTGTGGVSILSGKDTARSENATYDVDTGLIFMQGSVALAQGANTMTAERMTVNTINSTAELHGRVRTVLKPGANQ